MRVLQVIPDIGVANGVMSVILNYAKAMPPDITFDVAYFAEKPQTRQAEVEALGGKVYRLDAPCPQDLCNGKMGRFFAEHAGVWEALHIHCPHFAVFIAPAAKRAGIHKIAVHCHTTAYSLSGNSRRNRLLSLYAKYMVPTRFACSNAAGKMWYGNRPFRVLNNAIDCAAYAYSPEMRQAVRVREQATDAFVVGHIGQFHMPFIRELVRRGCRVEAAFKDNSADKPGLDLSGIARTYEVPFSRSPYSVDNLKAYQVLKKIIDEGRYDAIHCHTPMGAVVTRLAARDARKRGTKVIYTAHGFHFYNGAARKNWLLFYPVEKALAKDTDCLITINSEDYNTAKARQFAAGRLELVNGVGVDLSDFQPVTREQKLALRRAYGYSPDDFILIYPADFSARKNQNMLFDTLKLLLEKDKHFRLLLPGSDVEALPFLDYAKSIGVADHVEALGYRRDIRQLVGLSDVSVSSSRQEGLPINLVEAMALGNPVVATDVRGNRDLVQDGESGYLVPLNDSRVMADRIWSLYTDPEQTAAFGVAGRTLAQDYAVEPVLHRMIEIYQALELL